MDRGAWWATVHGVVKSWTQLSNTHTHTHTYTHTYKLMAAIEDSHFPWWLALAMCGRVLEDWLQ